MTNQSTTRLLQPFNAAQFDPSQGGGMLPVGNGMLAQIIKSQVKASRNNEGGLVELIVEIIEGENQGATGAYNLNLYHQKPEVQEIAMRQFSALCHVLGRLQVEDLQQLHNIPFRLDVQLQKEPNPNKYTRVTRVYDAAGNDPVQGQPGNTVPSGQQAPAGFAQQTQQQSNNGFSQPTNVQMPADNGQQMQQQQQQPQQAQNNGSAWGGQQTQQQNGGGAAPQWGQNNGGNGGATPQWGQPR